jgi:gamma-glutamylcyclotransferase (GGCT)/AIG2-like uncharacterized protein YtfP
VHVDAVSRPLVPDAAAGAGWTVEGADLDGWLAHRGAAPMVDRVPVLAFGSNRSPGKLAWLREHLGLAGPVVVLRVRVEGLAAVWAAGLRARDGARPATLAVVPGAVETHAVWMATPDQVAVLDRCEGRGERYDLVRLRVGRVVTEDGASLEGVWTYWAGAPLRAPLLVDGAPVACRDVDQDAARDLAGEAAPLDPGSVTVQHGAPDPAAWPDRVFVYGTLMPGRRAWDLIAPHVVGDPAPAWLPGRVHDTGRGYPALRQGGPGRARGVVLRLADPVSSLPVLDAYEGPDYRRVRAVTHRRDDSGPAWLWTWRGELSGAPVPGLWS